MQIFYDFNVPAILHLLLFEYPENHTFLGEGIAISQPPFTYECERSSFLLDLILCHREKKSLKKFFLVLEKCLIFPPNEPPFICTKY